MFNILNLKISKWSLILLLGDAAAFCLAIPIGFYLSGFPAQIFWDPYKVPLIFVGLTYILVLYIANLYDHHLDFRRRENISKIILSCLVGTLVVMILYCFPGWRTISRYFVQGHAVAFVCLTILWRISVSALALPLRLQRPVLIMGAGGAGKWIAKIIRDQPNCGLVVRGFVDDDPQKAGMSIAGFEVLGSCSMLDVIIRNQKASLIVVAVTHEKSFSSLIALNQAIMNGCQLTDVPSLYEFLTGKIPIDHISDLWLYFNSLTHQKSYYPHLKRVIDLGLAGLGLLLSWPLFLIIGLAIRLDTPGPIIFRQTRLGLNGKPFQILKFRTLMLGGEEVPKWVSISDPRITRVGWLLRKTHLDELPQLINILKGKMSLIGPRAEWDIFAQPCLESVPEWRPGRRDSDPPDFKVLVKYREKIPYYSYRLLVKPGVTGWAQVMFPYAGSSLEEMKEKLQYDLYYIKNMGLFLDLAILMKTIRTVLFGQGK